MQGDSPESATAAGSKLPRIERDALVALIVARLQRSAERPGYHALRATLVPVERSAYTLVIGAGFSAGQVPLVRELMWETIGDYDVPDQDMCGMKRGRSSLNANSRDFWRDYNAAAQRLGQPQLAVNRKGLPIDSAQAYQRLFAFEVVHELLRHSLARRSARRPRTVIETLKALAPAAPTDPDRGQHYVQGFLQFTVAPGSEHGDGLTGRAGLNPAHQHLARLLAAQQTGALRRLQPFCRTVFSTNFDTLLQVALQAERIVPLVSDRPERGFDADLFRHEAAIHLVCTHGSVLRNNPASAAHELAGLAAGNVDVLAGVLGERDVIAVGHSGWADSLTQALARGGASGRHLYWCDVCREPTAAVEALFIARGGAMSYVRLGDSRHGGGADGLMQALNAALQVPHP